MWYDPLIGAVAYCIKFSFTLVGVVWGLKYLAEFVFKFLTEELSKNE
jgi:hypothetical protein